VALENIWRKKDPLSLRGVFLSVIYPRLDVRKFVEKCTVRQLTGICLEF